MAFELPLLPYPEDALEPHMSANTLRFHHGKHHKSYVDKTNTLIQDTPFEGKSLEEVIEGAAREDRYTKLFNNAAQIWNHTFFWNCMKPDGGGEPTGTLAGMIRQAFGSLDEFKEAFTTAAKDRFGSGYAWLVLDGGELRVTSTLNAEPPFIHGQTVLLTCDVWEHAYYLDYQNRRGDFVRAFLDHLVNWEFAARRLEEAEPAVEDLRKRA